MSLPGLSVVTSNASPQQPLSVCSRILHSLTANTNMRRDTEPSRVSVPSCAASTTLIEETQMAYFRPDVSVTGGNSPWYNRQCVGLRKGRNQSRAFSHDHTKKCYVTHREPRQASSYAWRSTVRKHCELSSAATCDEV